MAFELGLGEKDISNFYMEMIVDLAGIFFFFYLATSVSGCDSA